MFNLIRKFWAKKTCRRAPLINRKKQNLSLHGHSRPKTPNGVYDKSTPDFREKNARTCGTTLTDYWK